MKPSRGRIFAATLTTLVLFLAGCRSMPTKSYYALVNDAHGINAAATESMVDRAVMVPMVEIAVPYDSDRVVYRTDAHEIKHFNYRLWVSRPQDMLQQLLAQKLERARIFRSVEPRMHSSRDSYVLLARIDAIEILPDGDLTDVRLAMTMRLRDSKTDLDVWEHGFDKRQRVPGRRAEVEDAIDVLNTVYNTEIDRALALLAGFIRNG